MHLAVCDRHGVEARRGALELPPRRGFADLARLGAEQARHDRQGVHDSVRHLADQDILVADGLVQTGGETVEGTPETPQLVASGHGRPRPQVAPRRGVGRRDEALHRPSNEHLAGQPRQQHGERGHDAEKHDLSRRKGVEGRESGTAAETHPDVEVAGAARRGNEPHHADNAVERRTHLEMARRTRPRRQRPQGRRKHLADEPGEVRQPDEDRAFGIDDRERLVRAPLRPVEMVRARPERLYAANKTPAKVPDLSW